MATPQQDNAKTSLSKAERAVQVIAMRVYADLTASVNKAAVSLNGFAGDCELARNRIREEIEWSGTVQGSSSGAKDQPTLIGTLEKIANSLDSHASAIVGNKGGGIIKGLSVAVLGFEIVHSIYDILVARQAEREAQNLDLRHYAYNYGVGATPQAREKNAELEKKAVANDSWKWGIDEEAAWESHKRLRVAGISALDVQTMRPAIYEHATHTGQSLQEVEALVRALTSRGVRAENMATALQEIRSAGSPELQQALWRSEAEVTGVTSVVVG